MHWMNMNRKGHRHTTDAPRYVAPPICRFRSPGVETRETEPGNGGFYFWSCGSPNMPRILQRCPYWCSYMLRLTLYIFIYLYTIDMTDTFPYHAMPSSFVEQFSCALALQAAGIFCSLWRLAWVLLASSWSFSFESVYRADPRKRREDCLASRSTKTKTINTWKYM